MKTSLIHLLLSAATVAAADPQFVTVRPKQSDAVLFNPGMGLYLACGTKTEVKADDWFLRIVNIAYIRTDWSVVEPEEKTEEDKKA